MPARPRSFVRSFVRSFAVAIVATLACLVLAGCADPPVPDRTVPPAESLARVQATAARVTEARTARLSMSTRTAFAGEEVPASTATTEGLYDFAAHTGQMDTTVKMAGLPFRFTERTLVIGSDVYLRMPEQPEQPDQPDGGPAFAEGPHKPWLKFDLPDELAGGQGFGPGFASGFGLGPGEGAADPTEALRYLTAAASKAEMVGEEEVRGVPTTRYAVTFDASKQAARLPEELRDLADELELGFPRPADVWIDDQGRLRKIQYAVTMKAPAEGDASPAPVGGSGSQVTIQTTLELYDFGAEVRVDPPPADQVEVIGPDFPPDCADGEDGVKGDTTGGAKRDAGNAEARAYLEFCDATAARGSTHP